MIGRLTIYQRIVALTQAWALEGDAGKRLKIAEALQQAHMENVTYVPLGQYRSIIAYRRELKGLIRGPALFYWNIEKN